MTEKSLKNDILFRYLFGAKHNKNILISLLNPIIELLNLPEIKDIKVINSFLEIDGIDDKKPVVDIRAVDNEGKFYNIEMQVGHEIDYKIRASNYLTKMHSSQLKKGKLHGETKASIGIHFVDFNLLPHRSDFYTTVGFMEMQQPCVLHVDTLYLIYIELPKVNYDHGDFTSLKKWLYFMENVYKKEDPVIQTLRKDVPEIDQAAIEYERFIADQTVQYVLQNRLIADMDYHSGMQNARNEGMTQGLAEGMTQGLVEGEAKGKAEEKKMLARNLKAKNFSASEIMELTGLSLEEAEQI